MFLLSAVSSYRFVVCALSPLKFTAILFSPSVFSNQDFRTKNSEILTVRNSSKFSLVQSDNRIVLWLTISWLFDKTRVITSFTKIPFQISTLCAFGKFVSCKKVLEKNFRRKFFYGHFFKWHSLCNELSLRLKFWFILLFSSKSVLHLSIIFLEITPNLNSEDEYCHVYLFLHKISICGETARLI